MRVKRSRELTRINANELVEEVKKKREFSGLPDSVVLRALGDSGGDVKDARKFLRKYFGVFLTNRVLKGSGGSLLSAHISSKKRDYEKFYSEIFEAGGSWQLAGGGLRVLDLGCGANGFSYEYLRNVVGGVRYFGVEAASQLVDVTNSYFEESGFDGKVVFGDLFDLGFVEEILKREKPNVCFLFQVVDALESMERDFSKKLISLIMRNVGFLVISLPLVSLGGRKKIGDLKRKWLMDFLEEKFVVEKDFEMFGERVICVRK